MLLSYSNQSLEEKISCGGLEYSTPWRKEGFRLFWLENAYKCVGMEARQPVGAALEDRTEGWIEM